MDAEEVGRQIKRMEERIEGGERFGSPQDISVAGKM